MKIAIALILGLTSVVSAGMTRLPGKLTPISRLRVTSPTSLPTAPLRQIHQSTILKALADGEESIAKARETRGDAEAAGEIGALYGETVGPSGLKDTTPIDAADLDNSMRAALSKLRPGGKFLYTTKDESGSPAWTLATFTGLRKTLAAGETTVLIQESPVPVFARDLKEIRPESSLVKISWESLKRGDRILSKVASKDITIFNPLEVSWVDWGNVVPVLWVRDPNFPATQPREPAYGINAKNAELFAFNIKTAVTDENNGQTVSIKIGDQLEVRLREKASAGYRWSLAASSLNLMPGYPKTEEDSRIPDSAARRVYLLEVNALGPTDLTLELKKPWETKPAAKTFSIKVNGVSSKGGDKK